MVRNSIYLLLLLLISSCRPETTGDHGHDHEDTDSHAHANEGIPTEAHTIWTDKTELFVEYPVLVVGNTSRFAAHFTILDGHQPVRQGQVTVSLVSGNKGIRHTVDAPVSPGIFTPALQPKEAGTGQLIFTIQSNGLSDTISIDNVTVIPSVEDAKQAVGDHDEDSGAISFLKEQAWKLEFQTERVMEGEVYDVIHTSGIWQVAPSDNKTLVANTNGTVSLTNQDLTEGTRVRKGQTLMVISSAGLTSGNLEASIQQARAELDQAKAEFERKQQLHASDIIPKAELEEVERKYLIAKSNYETLIAGYTGKGKPVIVPFDGYVKSLRAGNGAFVEEGAALLTITRQESGLLEIQVSPAYASALGDIRDIWYQAGDESWYSLDQSGGTVLSVGKEVSPENPLLPVFARIKGYVSMPEGSFTEVQIATGPSATAPVIPVTALLEDYGQFSVIVQLGGESFERRPVTVGHRNGNLAEITGGLTTGEMIVTRGAYQVKMASLSGQVPAHGHTH